MLLRYLALSLFPMAVGSGAIPWTTLGINVAGSFALGALLGAEPAVRAAVGIGFLGGFTTYSTFSVELLGLLESGYVGRALGYAALSLAGGLLAAWIGFKATT